MTNLQISQMTDGIRAQTNAAVSDMQHTLESARAGVRFSEMAAKNISSIRTNMDEVRSKMEEIAHATREEQTATTSMAQSAEHITSRMQKSESELQVATETLHELDRLAEGLQDKFRSFRM